MKKIALSAAAAALTLTGLTVSVVPALADPGGGAIIIDASNCRLPVFADDDGPQIGSVLAEGKIVYSPSGVSTLVCSGDLPEALTPSRAVVRGNLPCITTRPLPAPVNGDGQVVLTPSGRITGVCHDNPSNGN